MTWEDVYAAITSSAPYIDGVCVTGGEPLMRREVTLAAVRLTHSLGLVSSLVTNGYWARNTNSAYRVLSELSDAGLDKLAVSYDGYHNVHERLTNIRILDNLLACAGETNIRIQVQYCGQGNELAFHQVKELTGDLQVPLIISAVLPFGRGRTMAIMQNPRVENVPEDACGVVVRPVLTPEGDLYTCCGPARGAHLDSPLRLPIAAAKHTGQALRTAASSTLLNLLHIQGPRAVFERLNPQAQERVSGRLLDESICSLCRAITDDAAAVAEIQEVLEDDRFYLLAAAGFMQVNASRNRRELL